MAQTHFYALAEDLKALIAEVEAKVSLSYALTGVFNAPCVRRLQSGLLIPQLGQASAESSIACDAYLVTGSDTLIDVREISVRGVGKRYAVDQLVNPNSIVLRPAGALGSNFVLDGAVGTAHPTKASLAILNRFRVVLRKSFRKIKAFYVGPAAEAALERGARLTQATQTPPDFDLVR